jgi:hypothetical protein
MSYSRKLRINPIFKKQETKNPRPLSLLKRTRVFVLYLFLAVYSALLSDSIISILSNLLYIARFTITENSIVSKTEYKK